MLKNLRHHPPIMAFVRIPDDGPQRCPIGWPRRFPFLDQIPQSLLPDHGEDNVTHNPIRLVKGCTGHLKQQILFARNPFKVVELRMRMKADTVFTKPDTAERYDGRGV